MRDKVDYWLDSADEDLITAKILLDNKRYLYMGFLCHLIAEKALKAVVASKTGKAPPKIHDLEKLAKIGGIFKVFSDEQQKLLVKLMPLYLEGRYSEYRQEIAAILTPRYSNQLMQETEEFLCRIKQELEK
jgi:HEPN domain-containing protein